MQRRSVGLFTPMITLSLLERLRSRDANAYSLKLLTAMRKQFGGHDEKAP